MQWMENSGCFPAQGKRAAIARHYPAFKVFSFLFVYIIIIIIIRCCVKRSELISYEDKRYTKSIH